MTPKLPSHAKQLTVSPILPRCANCNETLRVTPRSKDRPLSRQRYHDSGHLCSQGHTHNTRPDGRQQVSHALGPETREKLNSDRWMGGCRAHTGGVESNYPSPIFFHGPKSCIEQLLSPKRNFARLSAALVGRYEMEVEDADELQFSPHLARKSSYAD